MKKTLLPALLLWCAFFAHAQTITLLPSSVASGPYGKGANISVAFRLGGNCFDINNNLFKLVISDEFGNFGTNAAVIKTSNASFFLLYLNGTIPNLNPGTGYKLRVESTLPAVVSNTVGIEIGSSSYTPIIGLTGNRSLNDTIFGTSKGDRTVPTLNLTFQIPSFDANVIRAYYTSTLTGVVTNVPINASGIFNLVMPIGSYYPLTVVHKNPVNSLISSKSYLLLNTTPATSLSNDQGLNFCSADNTTYTIDTSGTSGIGKNYPGSFYNIYWGDNTQSRFTHCQITGNNHISHSFVESSCSSPYALNNKYYLTMFLFTPEGQNFNYTVPAARLTSEITVSKQPVALFNSDSIVCVNKPDTILNASKSGIFYDNQTETCSPRFRFTWFVDGVQVRPAAIGGTQNWSGWPHLPLVPTVVGVHSVKLVTQNDDLSLCAGDTLEKNFCVEPPTTVQPTFTFTITKPDNSPNPKNCVPVLIKTAHTPVVNICRTLPVNWSVLDSLGRPLVPSADYSISDYKAQQPTITIYKAGKYQLQMCTFSSCDTTCINKTISVIGNPTVTLPPAKTYCGIDRTINFGSDTLHKPVFDAQFANPADESYGWIIKKAPGSTVTFVNGTGDNNKYPVINFHGYGTDTVIVLYHGPCENSESVQYITLSPPTPFTATAVTSTICSNTFTNISLAPASLTYSWSASSASVDISGFLPQANAISINNIQQKIINTGNASGTVTYKIHTGDCANDTMINIVVTPGTTIANAGPDQSLCNASFTKLAAGKVTTGTGMWTQLPPGNATMANASDSLTNISNLHPGDTLRFVWEVMSSNSSCPGSKDTVVIYNFPSLNNAITGVQKDVCYNQSVTLQGLTITGGNANYQVQWEESADSVNWTPMQGNSTGVNLTYNATQTRFIRRKVTAGPCIAYSNAATINVKAAIDNNIISASQQICANTTVAPLTGTTPTGANNSYTYQWENSYDTGKTWIAVVGAIQQNYAPPAASATTQFRRVVNSSICTGVQGNNGNVIIINVVPDAIARYNYNRDVDCAPFNLSTAIQTVTNNANASYQWYIDGAFAGTGIVLPGNYTITKNYDSVVIKLKTLSSGNCKNDSTEHKFYTAPKAFPAFVTSDTVGCGPLAISFTNNTPQKNLFTYKWDFGVGTTSTIANPSNIIFPINPLHGDTVYTVSLTASTPCENVVVTKKIRIKAKPQALFTPDKTIGCSPFNVAFNNTTRGSNVSYKWFFGDGSTLSTNSDSAVHHTFISGKQDTFNIRLVAINECGSDTLNYKIVVSPNLIKLDFAVNGNQTATCRPGTVDFINNTIGASGFTWDFGDGNFLHTLKNIDTVSHTYTTSGVFIVKLTATNGCSDTTDTETVKAYQTPTAKFNATPLKACLGDTIRFVNQTDTATGYTWAFGDGKTSVLTNAAHAYTIPGNYLAILTAVRQYSGGITCTDTASALLSVVSKLKGTFLVSDSVSQCLPFNVVFTNLSKPSVLTTWDFNNGKKDTGDIVQHNFITSGNFNVKMNAYSAGGCNFEGFKTIVVNGPKGSWQYDHGLICNNKAVRFEANTTGADSIRIYFGDGTFTTSVNSIIFHNYQQSGSYIPTLELFAGASCRSLIQGTDTIKMDMLKAGFTTTQVRNCNATTINFIDTSRTFYGLQTWQWNFGDGSPVSTLQSPAHTYSSKNSWPIQLVVTGKSGCSDIINISLPVTVNNKPKATIKSDPFGCVNQYVKYAGSSISTDSVILYKWEFANGATAVGASAATIYAATGFYTSKLIAGTINGCYDTATSTIAVNPSPGVLSSPDVSICTGQSTSLAASGAANYSWSPLQYINCTNCSSPVVNPPVTTSYVVTTYNSFGCSASDTVVVTVAQPFAIQVSSNDSICKGQSSRLLAGGTDFFSWSPSTGLSDATSATPLAKPTVTTTYKVTGRDKYNCFQDTKQVTIAVGDSLLVSIGKDQVVAAGTVFTFNPTIINGPVKRWHWEPFTNLSCNDCPNPVVTAKKDICYTADVTSVYNCPAKQSVCFKVFCENTQVFIPNAFIPLTGPNGTDVLRVRGKGIKLVKSFRIYNRWGQVVFERANFPPEDRTYGWNGLIQGKLASPDVYVYTCEVICENDVAFTYKGNVAVLK